MTKSSPSIWHLRYNIKLTVKISSIFLAFLENMNSNALWTNTTRVLTCFDSYVCVTNKNDKSHLLWHSAINSKAMYCWVISTKNMGFILRIFNIFLWLSFSLDMVCKKDRYKTIYDFSMCVFLWFLPSIYSKKIYQKNVSIKSCHIKKSFWNYLTCTLRRQNNWVANYHVSEWKPNSLDFSRYSVGL